MKNLRLIIALMLIGLAVQAGAQVTKRNEGDSRKKDKKDGKKARVSVKSGKAL